MSCDDMMWTVMAKLVQADKDIKTLFDADDITKIYSQNIKSQECVKTQWAPVKKEQWMWNCPG